MKKLLVILTAGMLFAAVSLAGCGSGSSETAETEESAEEEVYETLPAAAMSLEEQLPGEWYAGYEGLALTLTLTEDGSYTLHFPGQDDQAGAWALTDGEIILDEQEANALLPVDDTLLWESADLLFTREMPETYVPGEDDTGAEVGDFDGYWRSHFVAVGDGTMLASALGENTDVFVEGAHVALGGPLFGDVFVDMELRNGSLCYETESLSVTLTLQRDGFLRLTVNGEEPITIYLLPAAVPESAPEAVGN